MSRYTGSVSLKYSRGAVQHPRFFDYMAFARKKIGELQIQASLSGVRYYSRKIKVSDDGSYVDVLYDASYPKTPLVVATLIVQDFSAKPEEVQAVERPVYYFGAYGRDSGNFYYVESAPQGKAWGEPKVILASELAESNLTLLTRPFSALPAASRIAEFWARPKYDSLRKQWDYKEQCEDVVVWAYGRSTSNNLKCIDSIFYFNGDPYVFKDNTGLYAMSTPEGEKVVLAHNTTKEEISVWVGEKEEGQVKWNLMVVYSIKFGFESPGRILDCKGNKKGTKVVLKLRGFVLGRRLGSQGLNNHYPLDMLVEIGVEVPSLKIVFDGRKNRGHMHRVSDDSTFSDGEGTYGGIDVTTDTLTTPVKGITFAGYDAITDDLVFGLYEQKFLRDVSQDTYDGNVTNGTFRNEFWFETSAAVTIEGGRFSGAVHNVMSEKFYIAVLDEYAGYNYMHQDEINSLHEQYAKNEITLDAYNASLGAIYDGYTWQEEYIEDWPVPSAGTAMNYGMGGYDYYGEGQRFIDVAWGYYDTSYMIWGYYFPFTLLRERVYTGNGVITETRNNSYGSLNYTQLNKYELRRGSRLLISEAAMYYDPDPPEQEQEVREHSPPPTSPPWYIFSEKSPFGVSTDSVPIDASSPLPSRLQPSDSLSDRMSQYAHIDPWGHILAFVNFAHLDPVRNPFKSAKLTYGNHPKFGSDLQSVFGTNEPLFALHWGSFEIKRYTRSI